MGCVCLIKRNLTKDLSLIAMFVALIAICSWISIPVFSFNISLQTFAIFLSVLILGTKRSFLSVLSYILLGIIGVPVFSGFRGGATALLSGTGGFIIGFLFLSLVTGILLKHLPDKNIFKLLSMIIGEIVCFIFGIGGVLLYLEPDEIIFKEIFSFCVLPFIIPDIIKIILALFVSNSVKKSLGVKLWQL